jgi:hypothetical protein
VAEPVAVDPLGVPVGAELLRRYLRGPHASWLQATRVVAVDERGLLLWLPVGAGFASRIKPDGTAVRAEPIEEFGAAQLRAGSWLGRSALILMPPGRTHSVWWWFSHHSGHRFDGWYVNLEARSPLWVEDGVLGLDVWDAELDIVALPDRTWQWKDIDDLAAVTDLPGYWDADGAAEIWKEGFRVVADLDAGRFPFDGTWCDFEPDPSWPIPQLPELTGTVYR